MSQPLISIYMPTHNRVELLPRAVNSVLNQTHKNFELIIVDDGSTDGTWQYLAELEASYSNVQCVKVDKAMGACHARNIAINLAKGKYITGLDDDDEFTPNRLAELLSYYRPQYAFVCSNFSEVRAGNSSHHEKMKQNSTRNFEHLIGQNLASNQIFTETYKLIAVNGFNINIKKLQDWDVWLRLSFKYGEFLKLSSPSYIMHHDHEGVRVSNNASYANAFEALIEQNKTCYSANKFRLLTLKVKYFRNNLSLFNVLSNIKCSGDFVLFKWYMYQKIKCIIN